MVNLIKELSIVYDFCHTCCCIIKIRTNSLVINKRILPLQQYKNELTAVSCQRFKTSAQLFPISTKNQAIEIVQTKDARMKQPEYSYL